DALCRRVDGASRYVPLESLALSPQCGFASVAAGNLLSWDEQRRKLGLVVDTVRQIWAWPAALRGAPVRLHWRSRILDIRRKIASVLPGYGVTMCLPSIFKLMFLSICWCRQQNS